MDISMLWYDGSRHRTFEEKVLWAAQYYERRYGAVPNVCFVHPATPGFGGAEKIIEKLTVRSSRIMMVDHFWLGVEKATESLKAPPLRRHR